MSAELRDEMQQYAKFGRSGIHLHGGFNVGDSVPFKGQVVKVEGQEADTTYWEDTIHTHEKRRVKCTVNKVPVIVIYKRPEVIEALEEVYDEI